MADFKKLRRVAGLPQLILGRKARVSRSKIADVESGRGKFTDAERTRILAVLAESIGRNVADLNASLEPDGGEGN